MLLKRLELTNVLSFKNTSVELGQLNVLIGPNAVGKSNLIEAVSLLQAVPTGLSQEMLRGGGVRQWLWLGDRVPSPIGSLECDVRLASGRQPGDLSYRLEFSEDANGFVVLGESLTRDSHKADSTSPDIYFHRSYNNADFGAKAVELLQNTPGSVTVSPAESILAQFKNPLDPTPITNLGSHFSRIRIFREFRTSIGHRLATEQVLVFLKTS